jgi:hypothetical protein
LIGVRLRTACGAFNALMTFEDLLSRWTEAEMEVATYRLCHPGRDRPEVDFLCAQLKKIADHWYAELIGEVTSLRQQLPRL